MKTVSSAIRGSKIKKTALIMLTAVIVAGFAGRVGAVITFNDGKYHKIDYTINDYVYVGYESSATTQVELAAGGVITQSLRPFNNSLITISGGTISGNLVTLDNVHAAITGGTIGQLLWADGGSQITIYGTFDSYGQLPHGSPVWDQTNNIYIPSGHITGTLANGQAINKDYWIWNNASITLVPEPASALLLGIGAMMLRKKH